MLYKSTDVIGMRMRKKYTICRKGFLRAYTHINSNFFSWKLDACIIATNTNNIEMKRTYFEVPMVLGYERERRHKE